MKFMRLLVSTLLSLNIAAYASPETVTPDPDKTLLFLKECGHDIDNLQWLADKVSLDSKDTQRTRNEHDSRRSVFHIEGQSALSLMKLFETAKGFPEGVFVQLEGTLPGYALVKDGILTQAEVVVVPHSWGGIMVVKCKIIEDNTIQCRIGVLSRNQKVYSIDSTTDNPEEI